MFIYDKDIMKMIKFIGNGGIFIFIEVEEVVKKIVDNAGEHSDNQSTENLSIGDDEEQACAKASNIGREIQGNVDPYGESEPKELDYDLIQVSETNVGMSDGDFCSDDEEHLEGRRNLKWVRQYENDFHDDRDSASLKPPVRAHNKERQVKSVAYRLKGGASMRWDKLKETRQKEGRNSITIWRQTKYLLREPRHRSNQCPNRKAMNVMEKEVENCEEDAICDLDDGDNEGEDDKHNYMFICC
ncbi:conserved hypothetical protein [Ricinus communis]|uniref:Uncharacterized protein n=1 Tax=Ricinus communis TaxID=3988 RepID=B9S3J9_RICCO|nr:conserved hypothetical protein [Ricinus communis]